MNIHLTKDQGDRNIDRAKTGNDQHQSSSFQLKDKSLGVNPLAKIQKVITNSPRLQQLKAIQDRANNSPQSRELAQLQQMTHEHTAKQALPTRKEENKTGLPDNLKAGVESLSGYAMDDVKVHYNSDKPAELQAHAYTQGTDIHVAPGQEHHLPHEAWHVVQQLQGRVTPTKQLKGTDVKINDSELLEKEADQVGRKAQEFKPHNSKTQSEVKDLHEVVLPKRKAGYFTNEIIQRVVKKGVFTQDDSGRLSIHDNQSNVSYEALNQNPVVNFNQKNIVNFIVVDSQKAIIISINNQNLAFDGISDGTSVKFWINDLNFICTIKNQGGSGKVRFEFNVDETVNILPEIPANKRKRKNLEKSNDTSSASDNDEQANDLNKRPKKRRRIITNPESDRNDNSPSIRQTTQGYQNELKTKHTRKVSAPSPGLHVSHLGFGDQKDSVKKRSRNESKGNDEQANDLNKRPKKRRRIITDSESDRNDNSPSIRQTTQGYQNELKTKHTRKVSAPPPGLHVNHLGFGDQKDSVKKRSRNESKDNDEQANDLNKRPKKRRRIITDPESDRNDNSPSIRQTIQDYQSELIPASGRKVSGVFAVWNVNHFGTVKNSYGGDKGSFEDYENFVLTKLKDSGIERDNLRNNMPATLRAADKKEIKEILKFYYKIYAVIRMFEMNKQLKVLGLNEVNEGVWFMKEMIEKNTIVKLAMSVGAFMLAGAGMGAQGQHEYYPLVFRKGGDVENKYKYFTIDSKGKIHGSDKEMKDDDIDIKDDVNSETDNSFTMKTSKGKKEDIADTLEMDKELHELSFTIKFSDDNFSFLLSDLKAVKNDGEETELTSLMEEKVRSDLQHAFSEQIKSRNDEKKGINPKRGKKNLREILSAQLETLNPKDLNGKSKSIKLTKYRITKPKEGSDVITWLYNEQTKKDLHSFRHIVVHQFEINQRPVWFGIVHTSPSGTEIERSAIFWEQIVTPLKRLADMAEKSGVPLLIGGDFYLSGIARVFTDSVLNENKNKKAKEEKSTGKHLNIVHGKYPVSNNEEWGKLQGDSINSKVKKGIESIKNLRKQRKLYKHSEPIEHHKDQNPTFLTVFRDTKEFALNVVHRLDKELGGKLNMIQGRIASHLNPAGGLQSGTQHIHKGKGKEDTRWKVQVADFFIVNQLWKKAFQGLPTWTTKMMGVDDENFTFSKQWRLISDHMPAMMYASTEGEGLDQPLTVNDMEEIFPLLAGPKNLKNELEQDEIKIAANLYLTDFLAQNLGDQDRQWNDWKNKNSALFQFNEENVGKNLIKIQQYFHINPMINFTEYREKARKKIDAIKYQFQFSPTAPRLGPMNLTDEISPLSADDIQDSDKKDKARKGAYVYLLSAFLKDRLEGPYEEYPKMSPVKKILGGWSIEYINEIEPLNFKKEQNYDEDIDMENSDVFNSAGNFIKQHFSVDVTPYEGQHQLPDAGPLIALNKETGPAFEYLPIESKNKDDKTKIKKNEYRLTAFYSDKERMTYLHFHNTWYQCNLGKPNIARDLPLHDEGLLVYKKQPVSSGADKIKNPDIQQQVDFLKDEKAQLSLSAPAFNLVFSGEKVTDDPWLKKRNELIDLFTSAKEKSQRAALLKQISTINTQINQRGSGPELKTLPDNFTIYAVRKDLLEKKISVNSKEITTIKVSDVLNQEHQIYTFTKGANPNKNFWYDGVRLKNLEKDNKQEPGQPEYYKKLFSIAASGGKLSRHANLHRILDLAMQANLFKTTGGADNRKGSELKYRHKENSGHLSYKNNSWSVKNERRSRKVNIINRDRYSLDKNKQYKIQYYGNFGEKKDGGYLILITKCQKVSNGETGENIAIDNQGKAIAEDLIKYLEGTHLGKSDTEITETAIKDSINTLKAYWPYSGKKTNFTPFMTSVLGDLGDQISMNSRNKKQILEELRQNELWGPAYILQQKGVKNFKQKLQEIVNKQLNILTIHEMKVLMDEIFDEDEELLTNLEGKFTPGKVLGNWSKETAKLQLYARAVKGQTTDNKKIETLQNINLGKDVKVEDVEGLTMVAYAYEDHEKVPFREYLLFKGISSFDYNKDKTFEKKGAIARTTYKLVGLVAIKKGELGVSAFIENAGTWLEYANGGMHEGPQMNEISFLNVEFALYESGKSSMQDAHHVDSYLQNTNDWQNSTQYRNLYWVPVICYADSAFQLLASNQTACTYINNLTPNKLNEKFLDNIRSMLLYKFIENSDDVNPRFPDQQVNAEIIKKSNENILLQKEKDELADRIKLLDLTKKILRYVKKYNDGGQLPTAEKTKDNVNEVIELGRKLWAGVLGQDDASEFLIQLLNTLYYHTQQKNKVVRQFLGNTTEINDPESIAWQIPITLNDSPINVGEILNNKDKLFTGEVKYKYKEIPEDIYLSLKRLQYGFHFIQHYKASNKIENFKSIVIDKDLFENGEYQKYNLNALIMHSGGSTGGHYIAFRKENDSWIEYDDMASGSGNIGKVRKVNNLEDEVITRNIVLLHYEYERSIVNNDSEIENDMDIDMNRNKPDVTDNDKMDFDKIDLFGQDSNVKDKEKSTENSEYLNLAMRFSILATTAIDSDIRRQASKQIEKARKLYRMSQNVYDEKSLSDELEALNESYDTISTLIFAYQKQNASYNPIKANNFIEVYEESKLVTSEQIIKDVYLRCPTAIKYLLQKSQKNTQDLLLKSANREVLELENVSVDEYEITNARLDGNKIKVLVKKQDINMKDSDS